MNWEAQYKFAEDFLFPHIEDTKVNMCDECNIDLLNDNGMNVCPKCGKVYGYDFVQEYDISRLTIKQRSIYKRGTHLNSILTKYNFPQELKRQIEYYFIKLERIFEKSKNIGRKNMISYNVIIRQILIKLNKLEDVMKIPLLKTKKTRIAHHLMFDKLWDELLILEKDEETKKIPLLKTKKVKAKKVNKSKSKKAKKNI